MASLIGKTAADVSSVAYTPVANATATAGGVTHLKANVLATYNTLKGGL